MICKDDKGYTNFLINKNSKKKYLFTQSGLIYIKNFKYLKKKSSFFTVFLFKTY